MNYNHHGIPEDNDHDGPNPWIMIGVIIAIGVLFYLLLTLFFHLIGIL